MCLMHYFFSTLISLALTWQSGLGLLRELNQQAYTTSLPYCFPPYPVWLIDFVYTAGIGGGLSRAMKSLNSCLPSREIVLYLGNLVDRQRYTTSINQDFKSSFTLVPKPNVDYLLLGDRRRQLLTVLKLNTIQF